MRPAFIAFFAVAAWLPVQAVAEPLADPQRFWAAQIQQQRQERIESARERCIAQRGVDCDTQEGLQEWLLLDRSRAEAVLDRVTPPAIVALPPAAASASAGASAPPAAQGAGAR